MSKPLGKRLVPSAAPWWHSVVCSPQGRSCLPDFCTAVPVRTRQPAFRFCIFAVREIALGMGTLMAAVASGDVRRWVLVLSLIDTGEAPVLLPALRRRAIPPATGIAFVAADLGSSGSGVGCSPRSSETGRAVCRQPREQPDESRESAGK
jgi:hypothetical protein